MGFILGLGYFHTPCVCESRVCVCECGSLSEGLNDVVQCSGACSHWLGPSGAVCVCVKGGINRKQPELSRDDLNVQLHLVIYGTLEPEMCVGPLETWSSGDQAHVSVLISVQCYL